MNKIKLAIVGYGKMGKEIEALLDKDNFELLGKYDIDNKIQDNLKDTPDVALEFSTPSSLIENVKFLSGKNINIVCGTTGWYENLNTVKNIIEKNGTGFIYASNFSLGVNIFYEILKKAAGIINSFDVYDAAVNETHHNQKLDRPSGTALKLAELLAAGIERKKKIYKPEMNQKPEPSDLEVSSIRVGNIFGNHKVIFDSPADTIVLEHNAKSRRGFAEGALLAAKYIYKRKGFYKFEDIFKELIK
jgi:4-hydroxy-tetrahydrodipicolinate reductase